MPDTDFVFRVTTFETYQDVVLFNPKNNNNTLLEFRDHFGINTTTFKRECKNQEFYFVNGKIDVSIKDQPTRFFNIPKIISKAFSNHFYTLDIETRNVEGILTPIVIGIASKAKE